MKTSDDSGREMGRSQHHQARGEIMSKKQRLPRAVAVRTGSGWRAERERPCITVAAASSALLTRPIANDLELGNQMAATGQHLRAAASAQEAFFEAPMYALDVQGWPSDRAYPRQPLSDPVTAPEGARLRLWQIAPEDGRRLPPLTDRPPVLETAQFSLVNSGNRTLMAPKRSWKVDLDPGQVASMSTLNLKSMYNDPSQRCERHWPGDCSGPPACRPPATRTPDSASMTVTSDSSP